jgi:hypothetical protein
MSVNIIWSDTNGGAALSAQIDHGEVDNGEASTEQELFVRHDGTAEITNVGFFIRSYSGTYQGAYTALKDLTEMLSWGNQTTSDDFGGFLINFNTSEYSAGWSTYNNKTATNGYVHRTGVGDSEANAITLPTASGAASVGVIPSSASPNIRFKVKVLVPNSITDLGIRQWDQVLCYNFTS